MTSIIFGIFFINLQILLFLRYYEFEKRLEDINYFINKYRKIGMIKNAKTHYTF